MSVDRQRDLKHSRKLGDGLLAHPRANVADGDAVMLIDLKP
jgi:hypothetical protein